MKKKYTELLRLVSASLKKLNFDFPYIQGIFYNGVSLQNRLIKFIVSQIPYDSNKEIARKIDSILGAKSTEIVRYSVFSGIEFSSEVILNSNLSIIPFDKIKKSHQDILSKYFRRIGREALLQVTRYLFCLEHKIELAPLFFWDEKDGKEKFNFQTSENATQSLINSMSLIQDRVPDHHFDISIFSDEYFEKLLNEPTLTISDGPLFSRNPLIKFKLNDELKSTYQKVANFPNDKFTYYEKILYWFSKAISTYEIKQKSLELAIVLEFMFSESKTEVTHKIATRIANFLGGTFPKKHETTKLIKKLYSIRSNFVHGDSDKKIMLTFDENTYDEKTIIEMSISRIREAILKTMEIGIIFYPMDTKIKLMAKLDLGEDIQ